MTLFWGSSCSVSVVFAAVGLHAQQRGMKGALHTHHPCVLTCYTEWFPSCLACPAYVSSPAQLCQKKLFSSSLKFNQASTCDYSITAGIRSRHHELGEVVMGRQQQTVPALFKHTQVAQGPGQSLANTDSVGPVGK